MVTKNIDKVNSLKRKLASEITEIALEALYGNKRWSIEIALDLSNEEFSDYTGNYRLVIDGEDSSSILSCDCRYDNGYVRLEELHSADDLAAILDALKSQGTIPFQKDYDGGDECYIGVLDDETYNFLYEE